MRQTLRVVFSALGILMLLGPASAHPHSYVNTGGFLFSGIHATSDCLFQTGVNTHVCLPAPEVVPNAIGTATISIVDDSTVPKSGVYCQDLNANVFCGGDLLDDSNALTEPRVLFCGSVIIEALFDPTPRAAGRWNGGPLSDPVDSWVTQNWWSTADVLVFFALDLTGNPVFPFCGSPQGAIAGRGNVTHSP